mmetsp:Transcript_18416/g.52437  ORF Transcript_18416/g.52437 Transcript_18416/m.52437 type:complete len:232 (-) Transcript_18416:24-719(-)
MGSERGREPGRARRPLVRLPRGGAETRPPRHARGRGLAAERALRRPALDAVGDATRARERRRQRRRPRAVITQRRPRPGGDGLLGRRLVPRSVLGGHRRAAAQRPRARGAETRAGRPGLRPPGVVARQERTRTTKAHARARIDARKDRHARHRRVCDPGVPHEGAGRRGDAAVLRAARGRRAGLLPARRRELFLAQGRRGRVLPVRTRRRDPQGLPAHGAPLVASNFESRT